MEKLEQHCKNNILDFNFLTNKKINPSNTTSKQLRVLCDARFDKESRSQLVHILKTEKSSKAFVRIANQILGTELEGNNISTHKVKVDMDRDVSTLRHTPTSDDRGSIASSDIPPISAPPTPPPGQVPAPHVYRFLTGVRCRPQPGTGLRKKNCAGWWLPPSESP